MTILLLFTDFFYCSVPNITIQTHFLRVSVDLRVFWSSISVIEFLFADIVKPFDRVNMIDHVPHQGDTRHGPTHFQRCPCYAGRCFIGLNL